MLRGYRGFIVAVAGLALLTAAQQPPKQAQAENRGTNAEAAAMPTATPSPTTETPYRPYAERYSDTCYNAENHDTADLCAQWRAAIAAEKAAREARRATTWAIIATIVSALGITGLIVTIWQTHGALGEARRGNRLNLLFERRSRREARKAGEDQDRALAIAERNADAAERNVRESQRIGEASIRCYLSAPTAEIGHVADGTTIINCTVRNNGRTPAKKVTCSGNLRYLVAGKHGRSLESRVNPDLITFEKDIGPDSEEEISFTVLLLPDYSIPLPTTDDIIKLHLSLFLTLNFQDVFGNEWTEEEVLSHHLHSWPKLNAWTTVKRTSRVRLD